MRILVTGADQHLGQIAASALHPDHELRLTGRHTGFGLQDVEYHAADLREPEQVAPLVQGIETIAHLAPHEPFATTDAASEKAALDIAARGTFVLLTEALKAGVRRLVIVTRLEVMAAYPESYVVDESWKALPPPTAAGLAPYLAELTVREFVRAEEIEGVCLRMGDLGSDPTGTTPEDAARAIARALTFDRGSSKYRWALFHICSTDRYRLGAAASRPFSFERAGA
jgi:nucleoside-diphosphate-sugar epimerase